MQIKAKWLNVSSEVASLKMLIRLIVLNIAFFKANGRQFIKIYRHLSEISDDDVMAYLMQ